MFSFNSIRSLIGENLCYFDRQLREMKWMKRCRKCGWLNVNEASFCTNCGAQFIITGIPRPPPLYPFQDSTKKPPNQYPFGSKQQNPNANSLHRNLFSNNLGTVGITTQGQQSALPEEMLIGVIPCLYLLYVETPVSLLFTNRRIIIAYPNDVASLPPRSATLETLRIAITLAFKDPGFTTWKMLSNTDKRRAWMDLKKKVKEQGLPPVFYIYQPFPGIRGTSIAYQNIKKVALKEAPNVIVTNDWQMILYQVKISQSNPNHSFLLDENWVDQILNFLVKTPVLPKLPLWVKMEIVYRGV